MSTTNAKQRSHSLVSIDANEFDSKVLQSDKLVVVDFWAPWCGPCRMLTPIVEEVANTNDGVAFVKVNVDDNHALAIKYGVRSIPNLSFFRDGSLVHQSVGVITKSQLEVLVASF